MKMTLKPGSWPAAAYVSLKSLANNARVLIAEDRYTQPETFVETMPVAVQQPRSSFEMARPFIERALEEKAAPLGRGLTFGPPDPRFAPIILVPDVK